MTAVAEVTDQTFASVVLGSDRPVLVDYWADWCAPCLQLAPILAELAAEHSDRVTFVQLDAAANPVTPAERRVLRLPTLQLYVDGEMITQLQGAKTKAQLLAALADHL